MKLRIPSQEDITVEQYQAIEKCYNENGECDFSDKFMIKTIFGLSLSVIDEIKVTKIKEITAELKAVLNLDTEFQPTFILNGIEYGFIPNLDDMTGGEYADLEKYIPSVDDYHKAMSVMFRPIKNKVGSKYNIKKYKGTGSTSEQMKKAPFSALKSSLVFFWNLERDLLAASLSFISKEAKKQVESAKQQNKTTQKNGGGMERLLELQEEIIYELNKRQNLVFMKHSTS